MALLDWFDISTLFIYWVDIETATRPKNYKHQDLNGRDRYGFIYVASGLLRYSFADSSSPITVGENELIFIPRGMKYRYTALADTDLKVVQFRIADGEIPAYLTTPSKIPLPNAGKLIENFFSPHKNHHVNHPFYYMSCLFRLLWQIDEYQNKIPLKYKRLKPALLEINENYHDNNSVDYYANLCNMSTPTFYRLFKEYTKMSPIEYRNDLRLQLAQTKLQSGEYTVSETAALCGFSNLSYFTRLYKKRFGRTPKGE